MPKVSVIIPVYKVEEYLPVCLDAVDRQTYTDFELVLVDDGSPDTCGAMCDEYAKTHPNTKVIHQENAGLSEARNQGVKHSTGEYVVFIDSDDYVADDYIEHLMYLITKYDADVSVAKTFSFDDGQTPELRPIDEKDGVLSPAVALERICYNKMSICAWGKMYKRELVEKYPYPKGQLYEDTATTYKIVGDASKIAYSNHRVYFWRQRKGSITHATITEKHLFGIEAAKEQLAYMEERYPQAAPAARARCVMKIVDLAYRLVMGVDNPELFERIRAEVTPHIKPLLADKKAGLSLKARALALNGGRFSHLVASKLYAIVK